MPPPLFRPEDLERQERFVGLRNQSIHAYDPFGPIAAEDSASVDPKEFQAARTYRPPGRFNGQWMKCGYYGVIEVIDHHFGELIGALDEMGEPGQYVDCLPQRSRRDSWRSRARL